MQMPEAPAAPPPEALSIPQTRAERPDARQLHVRGKVYNGDFLRHPINRENRIKSGAKDIQTGVAGDLDNADQRTKAVEKAKKVVGLSVHNETGATVEQANLDAKLKEAAEDIMIAYANEAAVKLADPNLTTEQRKQLAERQAQVIIRQQEGGKAIIELVEADGKGMTIDPRTGELVANVVALNPENTVQNQQKPETGSGSLTTFSYEPNTSDSEAAGHLSYYSPNNSVYNEVKTRGYNRFHTSRVNALKDALHDGQVDVHAVGVRALDGKTATVIVPGEVPQTQVSGEMPTGEQTGREPTSDVRAYAMRELRKAFGLPEGSLLDITPRSETTIVVGDPKLTMQFDPTDREATRIKGVENSNQVIRPKETTEGGKKVEIVWVPADAWDSYNTMTEREQAEWRKQQWRKDHTTGDLPETMQAKVGNGTEKRARAVRSGEKSEEAKAIQRQLDRRAAIEEGILNGSLVYKPEEVQDPAVLAFLLNKNITNGIAGADQKIRTLKAQVEAQFKDNVRRAGRTEHQIADELFGNDSDFANLKAEHPEQFNLLLGRIYRSADTQAGLAAMITRNQGETKEQMLARVDKATEGLSPELRKLIRDAKERSFAPTADEIWVQAGKELMGNASGENKRAAYDRLHEQAKALGDDALVTQLEIFYRQQNPDTTIDLNQSFDQLVAQMSAMPSGKLADWWRALARLLPPARQEATAGTNS